MSDTTTTDGIDSEYLAAARKAGASSLFLVVAAIDPDAIGAERNYVATKLVRRAEDGGDGDDVTVPPLPRRAGDLITALWDGDLAEALYYADAANTRLLVRTFSESVLVSALAADRGSEESARRWLEPKLDRHGWDVVADE